MKTISSKELREKFLEFFKDRGHTIVPSSSLLSDDPSVLLTSAGMQQFKSYYTGDADAMEDFASKNTTSVQKTFRTSDIDEVGDESHLTFFEMLGNFSFGGYFKKEAIKYGLEFLIDTLKIDKNRIRVTYFKGDKELNIGADGVSYSELKNYFEEEKISSHGRADNFWGPTGEEGPCGPTVEFYVDNVEIWNLVFNEYYCNRDKSLIPLESPGVDTGMGLERLAMVVQNKETIFDTDLFNSLIELLPSSWTDNRIKRIIVDHTRAICFLVSDGVRPSNTGAGYILRRLIRRIQVFGASIPELLNIVVSNYEEFYPELDKEKIQSVYKEEEEKFEETLRKGLKELDKLNNLDAKSAFNLYQSYGLPYEVIKDFAPEKTKNLDREDFDRELKKHQEISRAGIHTFKGGLADNDPQTIKLHTAHHLLLAALKKVLGPHVKQRGSNITSERLRVDFSHDKKLTDEEKQNVEDIVNEKIKEGLDIIHEEMLKEEAEKLGAEMEFGTKYGDTVSIYIIKNKDGSIFSMEFCGGPHVKNTSELGSFKIKKEKAVSAGTRRIRAILVI